MGAVAAVRSKFSALLETLYPPVCPACRAETGAARSLCPACWKETRFLTPPACAGCGRPVPGSGPPDELICDDCLRFPRAWDRGAAAVAYGGAARKLVLGLKHGDRLDLVPMLAGWMLRNGRHLAEAADLIVPVPLHWTRLVKRRANQSAELARRVAAETGTPFAPGVLRRVRRTSSQDGKNREARIANLAGALTVAHPGAMTGRRCLLIDDVLTTGATLDAAAQVLKSAGAESVDILVIALAMREVSHYVRASEEESEHETG